MSKTIFRVAKNKDNPFVMIDRRPIENPKLSWKAKGILAYLLSRPDNWIVRLGDLVKRSPDGAFAVRRAIKELRDVGHISYQIDRENGHIKQWLLVVHEIPLLRDNQQVGNQQVENLPINDTDSLTDTDSKDIKEGASAAPKATDFPEVVLFRSVTGRYPARDTFQIVVAAVQKVKVRLGRDVVCEDLRPFWEAWRTNGFKSINLSWLTDWAVAGKITQNGNGKRKPNIDDIFKEYAQEQGLSYGN